MTSIFKEWNDEYEVVLPLGGVRFSIKFEYGEWHIFGSFVDHGMIYSPMTGLPQAFITFI